MIVGQFESVLDEKKRTALPKKFRSELGADIVITKGLEKNLIIVPELQWRTLLEGTEGRPFIERNVRNLQRFLLGNATEIQLDTKGRFVLADYLKEYAGIEKDIIFIGVGRFVEIWDKKEWHKHEAEMTKNGMIATIAEKLTGEGNE